MDIAIPGVETMTGSYLISQARQKQSWLGDSTSFPVRFELIFIEPDW